MSNAFRVVILACCLSLQFMVGAQFFSAPAGAVDALSLPELQQKQQQIDRYRSSVNQAKQRIEQQEKSARDRISGLSQTIEATAAQIEAQQEKLKSAAEKLKLIEKELSTAQAQYGKQQTSTAARLRFLQRQNNARGWVALMQSRSLEELMDRQYQFKRVYDEDRKALVSLKKSKDAIEAQKLAAETQKNQIALLTQQLATQKASAEDQAQTESILVNRLKSDREALTAAEQQLAEESSRISQNIQQKLAANIAFPGAIFVPGSGQFLLPSDGPVTSIFGWRVHPILGTSRFHNGVDFGADYGSLIRAADNGVVISAEWMGGYGNTVIIDHGNGLTTLYGHASQIYVAAGQAVQKGQPVAAVGSTGLSTGPHLHFEVRNGGEPIDPMPFL
ncbi:murein hydrolase activator EnvC family protein [Altericista sp. CCNU0014]|uniref:murein hydrolase activator EnvC family protein n=1 Tax=Altericista sp. CCNU0014 TaxID=3082949 RepID=UPI00384B36F1